jgi:hypothetical protein
VKAGQAAQVVPILAENMGFRTPAIPQADAARVIPFRIRFGYTSDTVMIWFGIFLNQIPHVMMFAVAVWLLCGGSNGSE